MQEATLESLTPMEGLLLRGAVYELLALGYAYPDQAQRERLLDLAEQLGPWVGLIHADWAQRLAQLRTTLAVAAPVAVEGEWVRLFSGALAAAPFETSYEPDIFRKQHALADIAGFYKAFGFEIPGGSRWQQDHMGVELEYAAILLQRSAYALEQGGDEQAAICIDALRAFLLEHLGRWSGAFAADLAGATVLPFFQDMAAVTRDWVELELRALDLQPDLLHARHIHAEDAELPTCGGCTGCGPSGPVVGAPCPSTGGQPL